ncbi:MAG: CDP-alcohol phosphatidyltransferase family protein [Gemmatimonadota bacterium]
MSFSERTILATLITLTRFPLLAIVVATLYRGSVTIRLIGVAVLLIGLLLDSVDGLVARRRNETSLAGSVLDIAADRTYELVLWFCFADLGLISMIIPLLVVARTALTDAFRSLGIAHGVAPFAQAQSRMARFMVASAWMRTGYSVVKLGAFVTLALIPIAADRGGVQLAELGEGLAWTALVLCLVRGIPVVRDGLARLVPAPAAPHFKREVAAGVERPG